MCSIFYTDFVCDILYIYCLYFSKCDVFHCFLKINFNAFNERTWKDIIETYTRACGVLVLQM